MKVLSKELSISRRSLILLSFLYLLLQTGLFLQGWFTPLVANSLILAVLFSLAVYFFRSSDDDASDRWVLSPVDIRRTLAAFLLIFVILVMGGLPGWIFPGHTDHYIFRQALYTNLIHAPWPLILPNGQEMSYYLAGILPSCMLARVLPASWQQVPILLNALIPLILATLLFFQRWKKALPLLFLAILFFLCEPSQAFFPVGGTPFPFRRALYEVLNLKEQVPFLRYFCGNFTLLTPILESVSSYHSMPSSLMVAALLPDLQHSRGLVPLSIALLAPISPLSALALMPIALWIFFSDGRFRVLACIVPALLALVVAVYFLRVDSKLNVIKPAWHVQGMEFWVFYLRYLAGVAFLILPLWPYKKHDGIYQMTALSVALLPILFIGSLPSAETWGMNELTLKGGPLYTLILGGMWCEEWHKIDRKIRWCMSLWLAVVILLFCIPKISGCEPNNFHRVIDMWNGHLYHEAPFLKQSVPDVKEPLLPGILLRSSGESERHFPGSFLPKADRRCRYGMPPTPVIRPKWYASLLSSIQYASKTGSFAKEWGIGRAYEMLFLLLYEKFWEE